MQETSLEWQNLHNEILLPESFVEITMHTLVYETGKAVIEDGLEASFSNSDSIINNIDLAEPPHIATLELNAWLLDGTFELLSDINSKETAGFVSTDMHNSIESEHFFRIDFEKAIDTPIPGLTIVWSREHNEYATSYWVFFYNGGESKGYKIFDDMVGNTQTIDFSCEGFDRIEIVCFEWSMPMRRMRIESIQIGHSLVFDKNQIVEYTHEQSGDRYSFELPTNNISFALNNLDGRWDLLNRDGYHEYLYERLPITTRYGMKVGTDTEWILGGRFYLTEWRDPANGIIANFAAKDVFAAFMLDAEKPYIGLCVVTKEDTLFYSNIGSNLFYTNGAPPGSTLVVRETTVYSNVTFYLTKYGWVRGDQVEVNSVSPELFLLDMADRCGVPPSVKFSFSTRWADYYMELGSNDTGKATAAELFQLLASKTADPIYLHRDGSVSMGYQPTPESQLYTITRRVSYSHPEIELVKPIKQIDFETYDGDNRITRTLSLLEKGDTLVIDNRFNHTFWFDRFSFKDLYKWYGNEQEIISGDFRADPRLDAMDNVRLETKYGNIGSDDNDQAVRITYVKYSYNGSFRAEYRGRRVLNDFL